MADAAGNLILPPAALAQCLGLGLLPSYDLVIYAGQAVIIVNHPEKTRNNVDGLVKTEN
jgi:hypothetical protein